MRIRMMSIRSWMIHLRNRLSPAIRIAIREPSLEPRVRCRHIWVVSHRLLYRLDSRVWEFLGWKNVLLFGELE